MLCCSRSPHLTDAWARPNMYTQHLDHTRHQSLCAQNVRGCSTRCDTLLHKHQLKCNTHAAVLRGEPRARLPRSRRVAGCFLVNSCWVFACPAVLTFFKAEHRRLVATRQNCWLSFPLSALVWVQVHWGRRVGFSPAFVLWRRQLESHLCCC